MDDRDPASYGESVAAIYDNLHGPQLDTDAAVELLAELAGGGRALELGIGTGRVALPLAERGIEVVGIDASEAMVARMRQKPGGDGIEVHVGDFADVDVPGRFSLVYIPFNTFFALRTQRTQIRCLANVCAHLDEGGCFVLDAFVPDVTRFRDGQATSVTRIESEQVMLDVSHHDPVSQMIRSRHVVLSEAEGVRLYPVLIRYCWPAELDAMALCAGLELEGRYGGYDRSRFDHTSRRHVSIYRRRSGSS